MASGRVSPESAREESRFVELGQRGTSIPDVVIHGANSFQNRQAAMDEEPHVAAQSARHLFDDRQARAKKLLGAVDFDLQQLAKPLIGDATRKVFFRVTELPASLLRQVD